MDFGGTSNCKNLKISVFGCFRVNLLEFGFRKYDLRKGDKGTTLSRLIGPVLGSLPSEVFEMNTYLSLE